MDPRVSQAGEMPFSYAASSSSSCTTSTPNDSQSLFSQIPVSDSTYQDTPPYDNYQNPFDTASLYSPAWSNLQAHSAVGHNLQQTQSAQVIGTSAVNQSSLYAAAGIIPTTMPPTPNGDTGVVFPNLPVGMMASTLTPAQQEKLKSIAMPSHLQYQSPPSESSPGSNGGLNDKSTSSPPEFREAPKGGSRKRKTSASAELDDDEDEDDADGHQPVKKTAHNMIEKRYRTNLNDKIAALRDSVPALRIMSKSARGEDTTEDREELHGLTPAHKLNKATVLSKATEYIRHLEKRNNRLLEQTNAMQARINAFEKLFMAGALNQSSAANAMQQSPPLQYASDNQAFLNTPTGADPPGMIPIPDDFRKILAVQTVNAGRPYPTTQHSFQGNPVIVRQQQIQRQQQMQANRWPNAAPFVGKLMVGSLAGLMIVEAVRESEQNNQDPQGRGLFAVPIQLILSLFSSHVGIAGYTISAAQLFANLKLLALVGALLWAFVPSLFAPQPPKNDKASTKADLETVPSLASPIHVRRQAWLTAIQTVWVPRHNFFLEAAALMLKTLKFTLRNTIGIHGYQMLTGLTEEQETARVKAWTIALDAQLAGGDVEINKSRLTLTLLASGTLPNTPLRLMLKALHVRVLLWQVEFLPGAFRLLASKLARVYWEEAKQMSRMLGQLKKDSSTDGEEELPEHLAVLLEQHCDDVLNDGIVERAYNLAWNRPTTQNVLGTIDGMNAVVEDAAVRSPMDAVSAWYSTFILHRVLASHLASKDDDSSDSKEDLDLAINVAPIGSNAQLRALVARTFLDDSDHEENFDAAMQAMTPDMGSKSFNQHYGKSSEPLSPVSPTLPDLDIYTALRCSQALVHLQEYTSTCLPPHVCDNIRSIFPSAGLGGTSLLGFTAMFRLQCRLHAHPAAKTSCAAQLEHLAGALRLWVGGASGDGCGLTGSVRRGLVDRCLAVTKSVVGMEGGDPGYGSMSEDECD